MRRAIRLAAHIRSLTRPSASRFTSRRLTMRGVAATATAALLALAGGSEAAVALGWAPNALAPSTVARLLTRPAPPDEETVVWGPRRFETPTGAEQAHIERIVLARVPGKLYNLRMRRDGSLSKATVALNGVRIALAADLANATEITRVIDPTGDDTLTVTVAGAAGASLTVSELQTRDATFLVFGPQQYTRTTGTPDRFQISFPMSSTAAGPYRMCVKNGTENGDDRLSSSRIWVNGAEALGSNDLNQKVAGLVREVSLQGENVVDIELRSNPGSYLTLCFTATDVTPPVLNVTAPTVDAIVGTTELTVTGTVEDQTATQVTVNGVSASITSGAFSATVPLAQEGANVLTVSATDAAGLTTEVTRTVIRDTEAPVVTWSSPADGLTTRTTAATVSGTVFDRTAVSVNVNGAPLPVDGAGAFTGEMPLVEGANFLTLVATDGAGNTASLARQVTLDTQAPALTLSEPADGSTTEATSVTVRGTASDATPVTVTLNGNAVTLGADGGFSGDVALAEGPNSISVAATDAAGNSSTVTRTVTRRTPPAARGMTEVFPVDLAISAPVVTQTVPTSLVAASTFLYTGDSPVQTGVAEGTIVPARASVVRGRVLTRDGQPLAGVEITIAEHAELGQTTTRANGLFDMAVNAGPLRVSFEKEGFLPVQRLVEVPRQEFTVLDDVILLGLDPIVTTVDFSEPVEVARGSVVSDADGTRQATMLFHQGTEAVMQLPDGTTQPLSTLSVRATEYTVGPNGAKAMPGELPPTSAYTYAVELSVDQALAAGATSVRFNQPVPFYVENFLGVPVGTAVPVGYYDRLHCGWVAAKNGRVIKILSIDGGLAQLDVDGSGVAASATALAALGITDAERERLAQLYAAGQELWRAALTHFSPVDFNFPPGPTDETKDGGLPKDDDPNCETEMAGSIIGCESQTLGEAVPLIGTGFGLHYRSDRVRGRLKSSTVNIRLLGASTGTLAHIDLTVSVAGRVFTRRFVPEPNLVHAFTWDGLDAYGRRLNGAQPINIKIDYVGAGSYGEPAAGEQSFGLAGTGQPLAARPRQANRVRREFYTTIGALDQRGQGLGGWSLSVHHSYDPQRRTLYLGSGERRAAAALGMISTVFGKYVSMPDGGLGQPEGAGTRLTIALDGSMYFVSRNKTCVRKRDREGVVTTVAGICESVWSAPAVNTGDGGPATEARLAYPEALVVAPDGTLYIGTAFDGIRRVGTDGIIATVAGTSDWFFIQDLEVGADCSLYVLSYAYAPDWIRDEEAVHRIAPDGTITRVAGSGRGQFTGEGGPATETALGGPTGIGLGRDGDLYITNWANQVLRVGRDGIIRVVAGNGDNDYSGDGGPALAAALQAPHDVAVGRDGTLYIADWLNNAIRRIDTDGVITTLAGAQQGGHWLRDHGDGGPPQAAFIQLPEVVSVGPDGGVYFTEAGRIRRIEREMPKSPGEAFVLATSDGSQIFFFDAAGRHLRTVDALTGALHYQFAYGTHGLLESITDGDGHVARIERDAEGRPTELVAPYGQRTALVLHADGTLAQIRNPAGEIYDFTYEADGLLATLINPRRETHSFTYDAAGLLIRDDGPLGAFKQLERRPNDQGFDVVVTTSEGRATTFTRTPVATGGMRQRNIDPRGLSTISEARAEGLTISTSPSGMIVESVVGPDPRFGTQSPTLKRMSVTTPAGLTSSMRATSAVVLADPGNPLSLIRATDTIDINGRVFTSTYDATTREIVGVSPEGRRSVRRLDAKGRVVEEQVLGHHPVHYVYDERGRLAQTRQGDRVWQIQYDAAGLVSGVTDPFGRSGALYYDAAGRLTRQRLMDGRELQFAYDANGNVTSVTPPGRAAHAFGHSALNLIETYAPPAVNGADAPTRYRYNTEGQLTRLTNPDGRPIDYGFDGSGRLTTVTIPEGAFNFTFNPTSGLLTRVTAPGGQSLSYSYDGDLPTGVEWNGSIVGRVDVRYNGDFRVSAQSVNGSGEIAIAYDNDGLLTRLGELTVQRSAENGRVTGTTLGAVTTVRQYDDYGSFSGDEATVNGSGLLSTSVTRNALGRITELREQILGVATTYGYGYDAAGRLTSVQRDGATVATYEYDSNGNRLNLTTTGGAVAGAYDAQDRLVSYSGVTYEYTANGDLVRKTVGAQVTHFRYNGLGMLTGATLPDGTEIEYVIDGQNRRIGKRVNGQLAQGFLYGSQLYPAAELDGGGEVISRFVFGTRVNAPEYMIRGGRTYRIIADHLGSVRLVVDAETGEIAQRLDYDEFGRVTRNTNPGFQPFAFAGGLHDAQTGLTRFGTRDYDATTGRWTTKDAAGFAGGTNLYAYADNDPINFIDPSGNNACACKEQLLKPLDDDVEYDLNDEGEEMPKPYFRPDVADKMSDAFRELNEKGIVPMINSGYRDAKDQERMRNGGSGSNSAAKLSLHQAGTGVDINGTASPQFQTIKEVMKDNGFKWGGGWKKPDPPHFEINDYGVKGTKAYKDRLGEAARKAEEYFKKCIKG